MTTSIIRIIVFILFSIGLTAALAEESSRNKVVGDNNVKISYTASVSPKKSLDVNVEYLYRHEGELEYSQLSNNQTLYSGDNYKIMFTPSEDCYIYIFQQGSSGNIYRLFPDHKFRLRGLERTYINPVQAGKTYYIPAPKQPLYLDQQLGQEKIYVIASRESDVQLEQQYRLVPRLRSKPTSIQPNQSMPERTIGYKTLAGVSNDPTNKTANISDKLVQRLQICEGCVSILRFWHKEKKL